MAFPHYLPHHDHSPGLFYANRAEIVCGVVCSAVERGGWMCYRWLLVAPGEESLATCNLCVSGSARLPDARAMASCLRNAAPAHFVPLVDCRPSDRARRARNPLTVNRTPSTGRLLMLRRWECRHAEHCVPEVEGRSSRRDCRCHGRSGRVPPSVAGGGQAQRPSSCASSLFPSPWWVQSSWVSRCECLRAAPRWPISTLPRHGTASDRIRHLT
jgi:hypothetical protein